MPKLRVGDIAMYYEEAGAGDPLVLIMGFGGDHLAWAFQVPAFVEAGYRVLTFDNRGVGQTDSPDHPYTTAMMAADTARLLDALGIEQAHVLGASMGGMIAQELALGFPARVRSLQLHCTYARPDRYMTSLVTSWRSVRMALDPEASMRAFALWLFAPATYDERPEFVEAVIQGALANPYPQSLTGFVRQGEAVATHDTLDRLASIRCPVLVAVAEDDVLVPSRFSRAIAARIPDAELATVPGAGHVYFWERPEAFNRLCLDFLARRGRG